MAHLCRLALLGYLFHCLPVEGALFCRLLCWPVKKALHCMLPYQPVEGAPLCKLLIWSEEKPHKVNASNRLSKLMDRLTLQVKTA